MRPTDSVRCLTFDGLTLVFGLDWLPLLGASTRQHALKKARRHGASHFVMASEHTAAMGLAKLSEPVLKSQGSTCHSAAQVVASLYPTGTIALLLGLEPGVWWLVAVHEGAVVARTDLLFTSPDQASVIMSELRAAYTQLRVMDTRIAGQTVPGLVQLVQVSDERSLLWRVSRSSRALRICAVGTLIAVLVVGVVLSNNPGGWLGYAEQASPPLNAAAQWDAWEQSRKAGTRGVFIHASVGMERALSALYQIPVTLAGWRLGRVECRPHDRQWRCTAFYRRSSREADNQGFVAHAPGQWVLRFPDVDSVEADWVVEQSATPLADSPLDNAHQADRTWLSRLQQVSAAFTTLKSASATEIVVPAPVDPHGVVIPRPDKFPFYQRRPIQIDGPLRSFSLLIANLAGVRWQRLILTIRDLEEPTLLQSRLHLSAQGDRYEWQI